MIYLDHNATTPMKPAVIAAVVEAMGRCGNASSTHRYGRIARRYRDEARAQVAAMVGVKPTQVIFTSGGTESNATALRGITAPQIITSAIEHSSVLANTPEATRLPMNNQGVVDPVAAEALFKNAPRGSLVSVMLANNETGVIQPVAELARLAKQYGHLVHTDAVQAAGKIPLDFAALGVDALTLSAHKIGGPQGVGALIVHEKLTLQPLIKGGGQEINRRAGTENGAGIVGFGVAAQLAADDLIATPRLTALRDELQQRLTTIAGDDALVIGAAAPRVAGTLCIAMRGVGSETQVAAMDLAGVAVSAGSACSSGKVKISHVLQAMNAAADVAGSTLRISLGWNTEKTDIERCAEAWQTIYERTKKQKSQAA